MNVKPEVLLMDVKYEILQDCNECEGDGYTIISCCGGCMKGQDDDICRECKEHCGKEKVECETCKNKWNEQ